MIRMLFLRDIDVDVQIRCRHCGHTGILPRAAMIRTYGSSYPVLSIAPHYRCSRCNSRDTETAPAPAPAPAVSPVDFSPPPATKPVVDRPPAPTPLDAAAIAALLGEFTPPPASAPAAEPDPEPPTEPEPLADERWLVRNDSAFDAFGDDAPLERPERDFAINDHEDGAPPREPDPAMGSAMAALGDLVREAAAVPADDAPATATRDGEAFESTLSKLRSLLDLDSESAAKPPAPRPGGLFRRR